MFYTQAGLETEVLYIVNGQCSDELTHEGIQNNLCVEIFPQPADGGNKILIMHNTRCHSEDRAWC